MAQAGGGARRGKALRLSRRVVHKSAKAFHGRQDGPLFAMYSFAGLIQGPFIATGVDGAPDDVAQTGRGWRDGVVPVAKLWAPARVVTGLAEAKG